MAQDELKSQDEQELQFKKRARRRLVGSVALVLVMIVGLPMLLEDRNDQIPKPPVSITIPSQDSLDEIAPEVTQDTKEQQNTQQEVLKQTAAEDLTDPSVDPEAAANEVTQKAIPETKPDAKVEEKPKSTPPVKTVKPEPETNVGGYYIQIGVFSDLIKTKQMQSQLNSAGFKTYTETIDTPNGKKIRLRLGQYNSKSEAEEKLAKVKTLGYSDARMGSR